MTRLPALMLTLAILATASIGLATDKKNDKKDDRRPDVKKHDRGNDRDDDRRDRDDDRRDYGRGKPSPKQPHPSTRPSLHDGHKPQHPGAHPPHFGGPRTMQFVGPKPQHGGPKPSFHGGPHPSKPCPCDQSAVYKVNDCRPALTSQGAMNFMRVFESAAAKGVENATIRAMNAATVPPAQNAAPCVTPVLPSAGGPPKRGR